MKKFFQSRNGASKGAALIIVLAFVVLVTGLSLTYFFRTTTDRQLAQSSYNDTSSDLLARSALDIVVADFKQNIVSGQPVTATNIEPTRYGGDVSIPNLVRRSFSGYPASQASSITSTAPSANGRSISTARWNSHYLIPRLNTGTEIDSTPIGNFTPPNWVLVTSQGPNTAPAPSDVIGRYAFAVYDEGGLIDVNLGGFPTYASLTRPTRPTRRVAPKYPKYPVEESEIMLAAFTPNPACQDAKFTPDHWNKSGTTGTQFSFTPNTQGDTPMSFSANFLPRGLSLNTSTGTISGTPNSPGTSTVTLSVTNCGGTKTGTLNLTIEGRIAPDSTPWPVNLARKGTVAFADLTTLPSTPTAITPTTPVGSMGGFPSPTPINKLMGWRNYATTRQTGASFDNPSFPLGSADDYAQNFLGAAYPLATSFTTVSTAVRNNRTDQAAMSRQELIKLRRTIGFSQSLLQYLGTFSRELNRPAPDWPRVNGNYLTERFDMTNLQLVIPGFKIRRGNGKGHQYGLNKNSEFARLFGLRWEEGTWAPGSRFTDPNYYGRWEYFHTLDQLPDDPDFFQIIDYAMNRINGGASNPQKTFQVGAALIDQYDVEDLYDEDPNLASNSPGNTITIIDTVGHGDPADYVYGIEGLSYDDPNFNDARPPFAPTPPPALANYVHLNRRFENVGEFGYAYNPASTLAGKTLDFFTAASADKPMLDFFTYNTASPRAGIVNLNTRNVPVLASIINGALLNDPGAENTPTELVSRTDALNAGQAIVQETTSTTAGRGPALNRGDVARLAAAAVAAVPALATSDETKNTIARTLADTGQARTWNLMIDVIAQTGQYTPGTPDLTDPAKFIVQGEKRDRLHVALDRDNGSVLGTQLEEVID